MAKENKILVEPLFEEISYSQAVSFSKRLDTYKNVVYFHSAKLHCDLARYSFIAFEPFEINISNTSRVDDSEIILNRISVLLNKFEIKPIPNLPPFQGGLAGY